MHRNNLQRKCFSFSKLVIHLSRRLENEREYVISSQIKRSGTSIGANVEEAFGAQSKDDFRHKVFIAYKEARESRYWLRIIKENYSYTKESSQLLNKIEEICKILGKILSNLKHKSERK